jgi:diguanylate cyclase (GGDEF)-like protein
MFDKSVNRKKIFVWKGLLFYTSYMAQKWFIIILLFFSFFTFSLYSETIMADSGVLDLRGKDPTRLCFLGGQWLFSTEGGESQFMNVPGGWEEATGYTYGEGIYSLTILRSPGGEDMGLLLPNLVEHVRIVSEGKTLYDSSIREKGKGWYIRPFIVLGDEEIVNLEFHLNNLYFREGGFHHSPLYGTVDDILLLKIKGITTDATIIGITFFMFLYNFYIYLMKFSDISSFYLGLSSLSFSLRGLVSGENLLAIFIPTFSPNLTYRGEYSFLYLGSITMVLFILQVFQVGKTRSIVFFKTLSLLGIFFAGMTFIIPMKLVSRSVYFIQSYTMLLGFYGLAILFWAGRRKKDNAWIMLSGGVLLVFLGLLDVMSVYRDVIVLSGTQKGLLIFLLAQLVVITRKFGRAYLRAELLTHKLEAEVSLQTAELQRLSFTDHLTGLNNRRRFFELMEREVLIHKRHNRALAIMMMDVDHFKSINDKWGHKTGDKALVCLAQHCLTQIRESDILGRLGGEEFAIALLETRLADASDVAERIRRSLEEITRERTDEVPPMTISIGLVALKEGESVEDAMDRADVLMYKAKEAGRNRVVF